MKLSTINLIVVLFLKISSSTYGLETIQSYTGGVVANGHECAPIGSKVLTNGGSAVDAVIATLFCEGVTMPQALGIGGGFIMTIYIRETKTVVTLNARDKAPLKSHRDMFRGNSSLADKGGLAVGVPGEVRGYWAVHQKYGKLPWSELVEPSIELCKNGHLVTKFLAARFKALEDLIRKDPGLRKTYINPKTNQPYKEGDYIKRPQLAKTLEAIAKEGPDALYDGVLTRQFVEDIQRKGGIITVDDMKTYSPVWSEPLTTTLSAGQTLFTAPLPSSGAALIHILNILNGFLDTSNINSLKNWQRIVEAFKYAFAKRMEFGDSLFVPEMKELINRLTSKEYAHGIQTKITDDKTFNNSKHYGADLVSPEDHGTAHVSVLAPNGDGVAATSSISEYFGAGFMSNSTGIILNNAMFRFSSPDVVNVGGFASHPNSYIEPGKRPIFSACPTIVVDENGDIILIVGAAGHLRIISTTALVTMRHLWFNEPLTSAVAAPRLHHQLLPMKIRYEAIFDKNILKGLRKLGHETETLNSINFSSLTAISTRNNTVEGSFDWRRQGRVCLVGNRHDDQKLILHCK